jgi:pantothenate kinase-related protein Tda10
VKFPEYTHQLSAELASYRQWFGKLVGELGGDTLFPLVGYLAVNIARLSNESGKKTIVVSIAGAQGTGKSTMTRLLASVLHDCFNISNDSKSPLTFILCWVFGVCPALMI